MNHILIYSDMMDPITRLLLEHQSIVGPKLRCLSVNEVLNDVEIHDVIENGVARLSWTTRTGEVITNDPQTKLINRVFHIPAELFEDFHPDDRQYAYQEFWAYLSFAFDSFVKKTASPSFLGLNNGSAPLPLQWRIVKQTTLPLLTPRYYFGNRENLPIHFLNGSNVSGQIHSYHKWNHMTDSEREMLLTSKSGEQVFVYQRPEGQPIQGLVFEDEILLFDLKTKAPVSDSRLTNLAKSLARLFQQSIVEILLFVDGENVCFASIRNQISPSIMSSTKAAKAALSGVLS